MGGPFIPKIWQPKKIKILVHLSTTWWLDCEYLWNATRHRQSQNSIANYGHSRTGKLKSVYFGPQMAKNRPEFWPTQWVATMLGTATQLIIIIIGDPTLIESLIIVTIWNVVFANTCKSRKLAWIWMKVGTLGWGLKRLSLARFQRNRALGFGESVKKWVAEALFFVT